MELEPFGYMISGTGFDADGLEFVADGALSFCFYGPDIDNALDDPRVGIQVGTAGDFSRSTKNTNEIRVLSKEWAQVKRDKSKWDESIHRFTQDGSYSMKWFHAMLVGILLGMPFVNVAQTKAAAPPPAAPQTGEPTSDSQAKPAAPRAEVPANDSQTKPSVATATQGQTGATDAASANSNATHYVIGAEDTLQVTVWKEPTLSGTFPVRPDGMISLVLVGDLPAAGRTPMQLGDDITLKLKKYVQEPSVSVVVLAVNSQRIYLLGEVGHVGPLALAAGMTPLQAIAAAGGLSPFANSKKIYILRGEAGKQEKIPFNYKQALKGDNAASVKLQPGDTIVVP